MTVVDLTDSYVRAAEMLTARLGLGERVKHCVGDALELSFGDGSFDVVWTQNSGMNIADKARLYRGFHRVLRSDGLLALQEPMAGPVQPPIFPLMWANDPSGSFLLTLDSMRELIEAAGFRARVWEELPALAPAAPHPAAIQKLIMGDALPAISAAGDRNLAERRLVTGQGVLRRI